MTGLITVLCLILITLVVVQIGKVTELASRIRGEEEAQQEANNWNARFSLVFLVVFLIGVVISAVYYKNSLLGYGPHVSASEHGGALDRLFNITLLLRSYFFGFPINTKVRRDVKHYSLPMIIKLKSFGQ